MAKIRNLYFPTDGADFQDGVALLKNSNRQFVIDYIGSAISAGISSSY